MTPEASSFHVLPQPVAMKKILFILFILLIPPYATAQEVDALPFRGTFFCTSEGITLCLDAYRESLTIPGMSFLGKMNGYMMGRGVYGTWMVTSCKVEGRTATLRLSNDMGSDAQTVTFKAINDSTFHYEAIGNNVVRKAVGRKLVKIVPQMNFTRTPQSDARRLPQGMTIPSSGTSHSAHTPSR